MHIMLAHDNKVLHLARQWPAVRRIGLQPDPPTRVRNRWEPLRFFRRPEQLRADPSRSYARRRWPSASPRERSLSHDSSTGAFGQLQPFAGAFNFRHRRTMTGLLLLTT